MLSLQDVHYRYNDELFRFNLDVSEGDIVSLMGPSGAGKSTLLSLVAGFIQPQSGQILVAGQSVLGLPPHQIPLSMLFQENNLFAHLTVRENIGLGIEPSLRLSSKQKGQVEEAAVMVGIGDFLDRLPEQLSGGQKQRVALARCFVQPHSIWLLDEPFSALDPVIREEMLSLVQTLAKERNIAIVMVTHHVSDAKSIATQFAYMSKGEVRSILPIEELVATNSNQEIAVFVKAGE
ncbi:thiamine ABC transporter ATP-binding protein [Vibrio sp. vnigr-6D03]|uniref:thiamine ABC transporter ATP-binding protein n=1 Tax=Vibrio sp. vnigr-6D03 TaxID=2058088 RepID=UPI000C3210CE|nr:thiamine ABC transporter ATP-binding protein [Vibrio sp. vnigr-6D03]PKF80602.1 thiamine ABC transporter ATP-binding protein [Vibrio sp. vnigr-6D03]